MKPTYTMSIDEETGGEKILARGVGIEDALMIAIEHDRAGTATVVGRDVGKGRLVSIGCMHENGDFEHIAFEFMRHACLPRLNEDYARRSFERKLLDNTGKFWGGRVETDEEHARRKSTENA
jgi:hypothetical protein